MFPQCFYRFPLRFCPFVRLSVSEAKVVKTDTKAPVKADPAVREATRLERAKEAKERGNQLTRQGATNWKKWMAS